MLVWELPDQGTKHEFRHWLDAIDTNLAAVQHCEYPEVVLDKMKLFEGEIISSNRGAIVSAANVDIPSNKKIDEQIAKGRASGGFSDGESDQWQRKTDITADWDFVDKSRHL